MINKIRSDLKKPFYKNSFYLIATSVINNLTGFLFWIVAANLYSVEEVGLASVLISSIALISYLSLMGFDLAIIRYFPEMDKNKIYTTSIIVVLISSILFGIIYFSGIEIWAPELAPFSSYQVLFILFAAGNSLIFLKSSTFIAIRRSEYTFFQNLIISFRILFLFPLQFLLTLGIVFSNAISTFLAILFSFSISRFNINFENISTNFLKKSIKFSLGNYIINLFYLIPPSILPIMVLSTLGPSQSAYYYISFTISSILFSISASLSTSLFVEGSHGLKLEKKSVKSIMYIYIFLFFAYFGLVTFGEPLLNLLGHSYVNGFNLLKTMALSSFFVAIYNIFLAIKRVQKDVKTIIIISGINIFLILFFSYLFLTMFGIVGIGYAWIIAYVLSSILIIILLKENIKKIIINFQGK